MYKTFLRVLPIINISMTVITILLFLGYSFYYYFICDYFMMFASLAIIIVPLAIYILDKIIGNKIPQTIKFIYLLFFFFSAGLGAIANFYGMIPYYDKFIHLIMGLLFAWIFIFGFRRYNGKKKYDKRLFAFLLICFSSTLAVFWEICEFTFDIVFNKHVQRGNTDTMTDIIIALIGSIIVLLLFRRNKRNNTK